MDFVLYLLLFLSVISGLVAIMSSKTPNPWPLWISPFLLSIVVFIYMALALHAKL
jgi:hypothetical protein